jgi:kinesin family member 2/24
MTRARQDLLNHRHRLEIREDGSGEVQIAGLEELIATTADAMLGIIEMGNKNRTTHATESNDVSSRSHAICQIMVRNNGRLVGKLSLIDLAGSERGADTKSHNRQRRMEGAEINKSLLALKECIRALDCNSTHIPYRASKLTLVLKDSFTNKNSRTVMIVNISPAASSADHTLNTLRYADRVKERGKQANNIGPSGGGGAGAGAALAKKPSSVPQSGAAAAAPSRRRSGSNLDFAAEKAAAERNVAAPPAAAAAAGGRRGWDRGGEEKVAVGKPPTHHRQAPSQSNYDDDEEGALDEDEEEESGSSHPHNDHLKQRKADIHQLHMSLRQEAAAAGGGGGGGRRMDRKESKSELAEEREAEAEAVEDLHQTIEDLFEEEEELLNIHMNVIQENAELLTEEGRLLQQIQGDDVIDYDIEAYANRLDEILKRKHELVLILQRKLRLFKKHLKKEEHLSRGVHKVPSY